MPARNRIARNADRDAARRAQQAQQEAEQPQDTAVQEQPDAAPDTVTEGTPEVTAPEQPEQPEPDVTPENTDSDDTVTEPAPEAEQPEQPDAQPETDAQPGAPEAPEAPEPEVTDSAQPDTAATPEPQEPAADSDGEQEDGGYAEDVPIGTLPPAAPETPASAPEPETPAGYTPPPDPDGEPVIRLEPEPELTISTALLRASDEQREISARYSWLVTAGAMLVAQLARQPEPGRITEMRIFFRGGNGRSAADAAAHAQLVNVLGGDMFGRALTHDNTNGRPGYGNLTHYEEYVNFVAQFVSAAEPVISEDGREARKRSAERRSRTGETNTYKDNEAERAALVLSASGLARDIARAAVTEGLSAAEIAHYRGHAAYVRKMAREPRSSSPRETRWGPVWNDLGSRFGGSVPDGFGPAVPAVQREQDRQPVTAGATA